MSKINKLKQQLAAAITNRDDELANLILNFFQKEFSEQDYLHVLRQERWKLGLYCPFCQSSNIQKHEESTESHFKYLCLNCNATFEDDSGTPIAGSIIPLQTWIHCWYLSQYCNSLQYIADRLGLNINTLINMLQGLQQLFQSDVLPLKTRDKLHNTQTSLFEHQKRIEEEHKKKSLMYGADSVVQPSDTAEYRRQKSTKVITNKKMPNV